MNSTVISVENIEKHTLYAVLNSPLLGLSQGAGVRKLSGGIP